jgi:hypothetical protein
MTRGKPGWRATASIFSPGLFWRHDRQSLDSNADGLGFLRKEMKRDDFVAQTVHLAIVSFGSEARLETPGLVPILAFETPRLVSSQGVGLGIRPATPSEVTR